MKRLWIALALFSFTLIGALPVVAGSVYLLEVNINGLENQNLGSFDLDVNFDADVWEFHDYFLTDALGSISFLDAMDDSGGQYDLDSVNLNITSTLTDLSSQPSDFILATLVFSSISETMALLTDISSGFSLSIYQLGDAAGNLLPFTISGTDINAVPIPAAAWFLGSGLIGLIAIRRRK